MTEAEWLTSNAPHEMLNAAPDQLRRTGEPGPSQRLLRLLACACCRRAWEALPHTRNSAALEVAERFADGLASEAELRAANQNADEFRRAARLEVKRLTFARSDGIEDPYAEAIRDAEYESYSAVRRATHEWIFDGQTGGHALIAVTAAAGAAAIRSGASERDVFEAAQASQHAENAAQADLVRDIFGNPFRPVAFSPDWRTDTAVALARQMYESRDFSAMPILADALQDAGCDSDAVLNHCREGGAHVRGCWVCDLVLGKE